MAYSQVLLRVPPSLIDRLRNLISSGKEGDFNIDVLPEKDRKDDDYFTFVIDGEQYPAHLEKLPTIVETHKTFDKKIFLKSGDVGQVLNVFEDYNEREMNVNRLCQYKDETFLPSGITPASSNIIRNRFERTRRSADSAFPALKVREVCRDMAVPWGVLVVDADADNEETTAEQEPYMVGERKLGGKKGGTGGLRASTKQIGNNGGRRSRFVTDSSFQGAAGISSTTPVNPDKEVWQVVQEDVVDFEPWMLDTLEMRAASGIGGGGGEGSFVLAGVCVRVLGRELDFKGEHRLILEHPELLLDTRDMGAEEEQRRLRDMLSVLQQPVQREAGDVEMGGADGPLGELRLADDYCQADDADEWRTSGEEQVELQIAIKLQEENYQPLSIGVATALENTPSPMIESTTGAPDDDDDDEGWMAEVDDD